MHLFSIHLFLYRPFLRTALVLFEILFLLSFAYILDIYSQTSSLLSKISFFSDFLLEFFIAYLLLTFIPTHKKYFNLLSLFIVLLFIIINIFQITTFMISSDFLTQTALNNVEFVGFLFTFENIWHVILLLFILIVIPFILSSLLLRVNALYYLKSWQTLSLLFILITSIYLLRYDSKIEKKTLTLHTQYSAIEHAPIYSLIALFLPKAPVDMHFSKQEMALLNHAGFFFHPEKTYPLVHPKTYHSTLEFNSTVENPNVILIFTEGTSARTMEMYNPKFKGVTPNLNRFVEDNHTMLVKDYYNHTAATYKGLHGQLCSLFPSLGGAQWNHSIPHAENIHYQCLSNIFNLHGYDTTFLNVHLKEMAGNDEMASHLGFTHVLSAEALKKHFLQDKTAYREHELTDHQAYSALTNYLKVPKKKPFFITMYTAETHAWCNISKDGIGYGNNKNEVLNTLHNADDAFGKFWNYFKTSKYAKNTIIIFTADHAHYFDNNYYALMAEKKEKYHKIFIDKVPLFIYAPMLSLPQTLAVKQATSINLAPTILHLMGIQNIPNAFLGDTLFEKAKTDTPVNVAAYDRGLYIIDKETIHFNQQTSPSGKKFFDLIAKFFAYSHQLELHDNIYPK